MGSRVVRPDTTTLYLANGEWLLVKKRLNHGEQQDAFARKYIADAFGGNRLNLRTFGMEKVTAYLIDWNLTGLDEQVMVIRGKPIEEVEAALNSIDPESFAEISNVIETHEAAVAAARAEEKKLPAGASGSPATSSSDVPPG